MNVSGESQDLADALVKRINDDPTVTLTKKRLLRHYVSQLHEKRDIAVLKLFSRMDELSLLAMARFTASVLRNSRHDDLVHLLQSKHVEAFDQINDAVKGAALNNPYTVAHSNDEQFSADLIKLYFDRTEEIPFVCSIILERGLTNMESLATVLKELESKHSSLQEGAL